MSKPPIVVLENVILEESNTDKIVEVETMTNDIYNNNKLKYNQQVELINLENERKCEKIKTLVIK